MKTIKERVDEIIASEPMERLLGAENFLMTTGRMGNYEGKTLIEVITTVLEEHEKHLKDIPMGVSQWKNHGKRYEYWNYFKRQIIEKTLKSVISKVSDETQQKAEDLLEDVKKNNMA